MIETPRITIPSYAEIKRLEFAARRSATAEALGEFRSTFRGHGLTLADLREYIPGDEIKRIHWKASARTGKTYVKNFEEERQMRIHVAVDFSSSLYAGDDRSALAKAIDCAALLCAFGVFNRDPVSLSLFGQNTLAFVPQKSSRFHLKKLFNTLVEKRPLAGQTDLKAHLEFLSQTIRKRSVVFILSDFACPPFETALRQLMHVHEVSGIEVAPYETLPSEGLFLFQDPESGKEMEIDAGYAPARESLENRLQQRSNSLQKLFRAYGGDFIRFEKNALFTLQALTRAKRRRIR